MLARANKGHSWVRFSIRFRPALDSPLSVSQWRSRPYARHAARSYGRRRPGAHRPGQTRRWLGPHGAGIAHHAAATARVQSGQGFLTPRTMRSAGVRPELFRGPWENGRAAVPTDDHKRRRRKHVRRRVPPSVMVSALTFVRGFSAPALAMRFPSEPRGRAHT